MGVLQTWYLAYWWVSNCFFHELSYVKGLDPPFLSLFSMSFVLPLTICLVSWIPRIPVLCTPVWSYHIMIRNEQIKDYNSRSIINKIWASNEKEWTIQEQGVKRSWSSNKPFTTHEKVLKKSWSSMLKVLNKSLKYYLKYF